MKKYVALSLGLFVTIVAIIFAVALFNRQSNNSSTNSAEETNIDITTNNNSGKTENDNSSVASANKTYSTQEVSAHNSVNDCWLIIENKVYNLTSYINQHPDGPQSIVKYCGQDGTTGFQTKDKKRAQDHSFQAYKLLEKYYVGDL